MVTVAERKANERMLIFQKTQGICHFCGDELGFEKYDLKDETEPGDWNYDHVNQKFKGGSKDIENCLPAHTTCNRIRWNYKGERLRELISLGIVADGEIRKDTALGRRLKEIRAKRKEQTRNRRRRNKTAILDDVERLSEI